MNEFPEKLQRKIIDRKQKNTIRTLSIKSELIDFSSNDYLGFSFSEEIFQNTHQHLIDKNLNLNGATGSRLLSGNHELHEKAEHQLANFFNVEGALMFNSGYDANVGLLSAVPQRGDIVLYDELIHASIRDGIRLSNAKAYSFKHNDISQLKVKLEWSQENVSSSSEIYIVTESVFSMDGDSPDLEAIVSMCTDANVHLIVDEAHAVGVLGKKGQGLVQSLNIEDQVFARVCTFGKALGCHGAAVLGSLELKSFLVNYARSFIYTTAMSIHAAATISTSLDYLAVSGGSENSHEAIQKLTNNIQYFNALLANSNYSLNFIESNSAIHCCLISGNDEVKTIAKRLQEIGFDIKPILSPTVPLGQERLRICLHSFNTKEEINTILQFLTTIA